MQWQTYYAHIGTKSTGAFSGEMGRAKMCVLWPFVSLRQKQTGDLDTLINRDTKNK
jgi:hypothetical protein